MRRGKLLTLSLSLAMLMSSPTLRGAEPLTLSSTIEKAEQRRVEAIARATKSAVSVFVPGGGGGGSGVLISPDGYALTNFHVTSPAGSAMRCGLSDGNIYDAVIVGIDPVGDLAMIRLLGLDGKPRSDFPYAELGNSLTAEAGDWCMVIGNPFLLATNLQPTVTWGILSGVRRYQYPSGTLLEYGDCLQTDASVNPGNSGGPIYDADGKLLGIVGRCSFEKRGRVNVGVGYAISINQAVNFLGYLHSGRIVDHATLGATVATDQDDGSVRVTNILESSDAYRRGLRYASEVLSVDGRIVQSANDLQKVLATIPAGWRVKMSYREDGKTVDTLVRLRSVHLQDELLEKMSGALPPPPPIEKEKEKEKEDDSDDEEDSDEVEPDAAADDKIPPAVRKQLIERKGYANYFFNQKQQTRFIDSLRSQFPGQADQSNPAWEIEGNTVEAKPRPVKIRVGPDAIAMMVGETPMTAEDRGELYDAISQRSIGGIVSALEGWRRMLADGPKKFGESFYLGTMPLGGQRPLRDCMVGIDGEIEVRFLSHPDTGVVEVVEAFADRDEDPAELWILRDEVSSDQPPQMLDLRYGTDSVLKIKIDSWKKVEAK
ncbi:putative periplasmic serine endoprotease DegP-like precursor [Rubripirellula obstinata]|uniref:Putative periplasmic serine endoprotease DegP-like n=1 Tax=Rubripirellula obstinata TaxID=406547 RepID=A0A5B1CF37_9BACT|nr:trypsin-like peptidase domain-containing protein [Rubripirellula obstinata]KAA1257944.1 putative periplasmic serine endoprotease DegP-like precursor [Rubripirellula obstinata]